MERSDLSYTHYIRVVGENPGQGNWIRYMDWLSTDDVIMGLNIFSVSISPSLGILTIPITARPRIQYTRTIAGGGYVNGFRTTPKVKRTPYRWEFNKSNSPKLLSDEVLLKDFGRAFCNLFLTDKLFDVIAPKHTIALLGSAQRGVDHNNNWEHQTFLHQVLNPSAEKAYLTASLQYKLVRDTTLSTQGL